MQTQELDVIRSLTKELGPIIAVVVFLALLVLAALAYALRAFAQKFAEAKVEEQLERHRHDLQRESDRIRLDLQRRLADFGLFNEHRHRAYRALFARALKAESALGGLFGLSWGNDYTQSSVEDIGELLTRRQAPGEARSAILDRWDSDRRQATKQLSETLHTLDIRDAHRAFIRFKNAFYLSEIYLSTRVRVRLSELNLVLSKLSAAVLSSESTGMTGIQLKESAHTLVMRLRDAMAADLSRGDYGTEAEENPSS